MEQTVELMILTIFLVFATTFALAALASVASTFSFRTRHRQLAEAAADTVYQNGKYLIEADGTPERVKDLIVKMSSLTLSPALSRMAAQAILSVSRDDFDPKSAKSGPDSVEYMIQSMSEESATKLFEFINATVLISLMRDFLLGPFTRQVVWSHVVRVVKDSSGRKRHLAISRDNDGVIVNPSIGFLARAA